MSGLEFLTQNKSKMSCQKVINYWNIQNCIHIWTILTKGHGEPMFWSNSKIIKKSLNHSKRDIDHKVMGSLTSDISGGSSTRYHMIKFV